MRILHYYDDKDTMISQHVKLLTDSMGKEAENYIATETEQAKTLLRGGHNDILHLHGCWRNSSRSIVNLALRQGSRLVVTPHGQLEPWIKEEGYWKEKLPKQLLYQRNIIEKAYAVIIQGRMEQECMNQLKWNPRTVIIRNAVVTSSITAKDMARETFKVYQKVLDSNPLERMSEETRQTLFAMIIAGTTGDRRWIPEEVAVSPLSADDWRLLLCYGHQEQITDTLQRGIRILGLDAPDIDYEHIDYFLPEHYAETKSIQQSIGNEFATENERLLATFRMLRKWETARELSIKHVIELNRELREHGCDEEELAEELMERRLWKMVSRLMQVAADLTGLTEGFMPVTPTDDRQTRKMRRQIENHLKI